MRCATYSYWGLKLRLAHMDSEVWIGFVRRYKGYRDPLVLKFILELIGEAAVAVVVG